MELSPFLLPLEKYRSFQMSAMCCLVVISGVFITAEWLGELVLERTITVEIFALQKKLCRFWIKDFLDFAELINMNVLRNPLESGRNETEIGATAVMHLLGKTSFFSLRSRKGPVSTVAFGRSREAGWRFRAERAELNGKRYGVKGGQFLREANDD